jgi:AraC-like DNA-binding protein
LVKENILQHKDVQYYADKLFITNKYLILIVKKATGKTPHQIIDEALLKEACVLLGYPEKISLRLHLKQALILPLHSVVFLKSMRQYRPKGTEDNSIFKKKFRI